MLGTRCGIIKQQTSTMSQKLDLEIIQRTVESWVRQFFPRGTQYHEGLAVSDLAETITGGRAIEYYEHGRFSILDAEAALLQGNEESTPFKNSPSPIDPILLTESNHLLPGAAVFATNVGHFGLGSGAARVGDEIFVVFGCSFPIVMRHVEDSKYTIVGPCYVPKLSHGEAVLGPLPDGWRMIFNGEAYEAFIAPDGRQTFEDPRLDTELPPEWSQDDHEGRRLCWKKLGDSKCRKTDPRQTPEQLEARGIKLENIKVV
ncbi:hypothetical protein CGCA056_v009896 [Colletotrichum aenigma]|uniref:uncharacterized protein n=1 Tax=Colletotrichum aenigma TaxID=1215731 RepID=UPI0018729EAB|nr:uncharacterized protein CGCA056_v009896 [Colletotrichum aenigma]KAF5518762.1 hypothetical protein CGCA056_v009896 [Colletotrichum aenigma]